MKQINSDRFSVNFFDSLLYENETKEQNKGGRDTKKSVTRSLFESLSDGASGNTIKEYAMNYLDGYIDIDVTDTEVDMLVAFSFDFNEEPDADFKAYSDFMRLIAERTKIVRVNSSSYGNTLVCDFGSVFKPYNEQLKEFFDMDNSEFDEDEAWAEAVLNLEPLLSGNAGDSSYNELISILNSKPMNEAEKYCIDCSATEVDAKLPSGNDKIKKEIIKGKAGKGPNGKNVDLIRYVGSKEDLENYAKKQLPDFIDNIKKLNEADNLESIIDEAARYLFDEGDKDYLPDYEEFNDYTMEISKDLFDKAEERALNALETKAAHEYEDYDGSNRTLLELNDNHTIWELNDNGKDVEEWYSIIDSKKAAFEAETGVELYFAGRSGRHVCVEPTYDNCLNFGYLQEVQEKLEQEAIAEFNGTEINESSLNKEEKVDPNNLTKEQLWKLRQEIVLGSLYTHDYNNSYGIDPSAVCNFFDSFIEDAQTDDYGKPNNRKAEEYDNAEDLYNYYCSCENSFGETKNINEAYGKSTLGNVIKSFRDNGQDEGLIGRIWIDANGKTYDMDLFKIDGEWSLKKGLYIPDDLQAFVDDYGYDNLVKDAVEYMLNYREKSKKINEDTTIDDDPDLDKDQVNNDVDYWTEVDEANTEDVTGMEPVGTYVVSNNFTILIYKIDYDIDDKVLVGDSSDTSKARWIKVIYEPTEDDETDVYFYYGDIKVPFNEVMRNNI